MTGWLFLIVAVACSTLLWPVAMLVIGHFAYREHLGRAQLAGCLVGALSVLLLALGSR